MKEFLSKHKYLLIAILINLFLFCLITIPNKQIPGPLYGGDLYYSLGHSIHLYDGGSIIDSFHASNAKETYPWFFHLITAYFAKYTGLDIYWANLIIIPIILNLILFLIWFGIFKILFKDELFSLILAELALICVGVRNYYYASGFADLIMLPLTLLVILWYFENKTLIRIQLCALIIGIAGLTQIHNLYFAGGLFFLLMVNSYFKEKITALNISREVSAMIVGLAIAFLYFFIPVFYYHGTIINNWQQYAISPLTLGSFFTMFFWDLAGRFTLLKILAFFGIGVYLGVSEKKQFILLPIVLLLGLVGFVHPIFTVPLLGTDFGYYKYECIVNLGYTLFAGFGIYYLLQRLSLFKSILAKQFVFTFLFILLLGITFNSLSQDRWAVLGYSNDNSQFAPTLYKEVKSIAGVNDVFIGEHPESLFALNAATGRKAILIRRTHFTAFEDYDKRATDLALILYGNNDTLRKELIYMNNISYVYLDGYSEQSKKTCYENWNNFKDPQYAEASYACLQTDVKYKELLEQNGIETQEVYVRKDVSRNDAQRFKLLAIRPSQLKINVTPINAYMQQGFIIGKVN